MPAVNREAGRSQAEQLAGYQRAGSIAHVAPAHLAEAWVVENVATVPRFRRKGLADRLLAEILERGRRRGAHSADIGVLIGNDPAQRAYEKCGFRVVGEKRHPEFEEAYKCPGIRALTRAI
jgi:ribosomal protein S18 acetylase RimI-like enzyme